MSFYLPFCLCLNAVTELLLRLSVLGSRASFPRCCRENLGTQKKLLLVLFVCMLREYGLSALAEIKVLILSLG